ncbi:rhomboid family intramembrane serine protease [Olivibacter sp. XZL3]|uniref:rhomboid family intramembrane serine protease n=1 Tax=Olivibacter sp. XZL3 TaxID=1735116 RepID=UPI001065220C|nr:rhomboid family intramembrane serine protease [Olivibacter sp. XZL3]
MKRSFFGELYYKAFQSGNTLNLFIAINTIVFIVMGFFSVVDFFAKTPISSFLIEQLSLPANLNKLLYRPWSIATYMFTQVDFFHFLFNMLWLYWIGLIFLDFLNTRQFIFTYLAGGLVGGALFLVLYNLVPSLGAGFAVLVGSSGAVYAIVVATATLTPDYTIRLLFFGNVRLKYLAVAFIVLNLLGLGGGNLGGNLAHLGGGLLGFVYILQLRKGNDWSKILQAKKKKLRVIKNDAPSKNKATFTNQEYIDSILDKISQSGYSSLSKAEKEALFNAGKQDQD